MGRGARRDRRIHRRREANALRKATGARQARRSSASAPAPRDAPFDRTASARCCRGSPSSSGAWRASRRARATARRAEAPVAPQRRAAPSGRRRRVRRRAPRRPSAASTRRPAPDVVAPVVETRGARPSTSAARRCADRRPHRRAEPAMGLVHRRQRADAHRRRRAVLRRRVPAALLRRAFRAPDRVAPRGGRGVRRRADRARRAACARRGPGYGLSLQGAGAGILYLTTFAAFRLYGVLPETPAIALLVAVSARACGSRCATTRSRWPALAIAGGFLAPMLVATGGEPRSLFGYFAVLNGAIFALAWTRAWRALNAVGFVFTFVLAAFWGHGFYRPEHYAVVQPFLVLFFVFYVAIAILYARRGPVAAKDPVDALLVFGVPLVGFALQAALVRDIRVRRRVERARAGASSTRSCSPRCAGAAEPGIRAARARVPRAGGHLRHDRGSVRVRPPRDRGAVGGRGGRRVLDRRPADARLARGVRAAIESAPASSSSASGVGRRRRSAVRQRVLRGRAADRAVRARDGAHRRSRGRAVARGRAQLVAVRLRVGRRSGGSAPARIELVRQLSRADEPHAVLAWVTASVAAALVLARLLGVAAARRRGLRAAAGDGARRARRFRRRADDADRLRLVVWPCAWLVHWLALRSADTPGCSARVRAGGSNRSRLLRAAHAASAFDADRAGRRGKRANGPAARPTPQTAWTRLRGRAARDRVPAALCALSRQRALARAAARRRVRGRRRAARSPGCSPSGSSSSTSLSPGDPSPLPYVPLANPLDVTLALALGALVALGAALRRDARARALPLGRRGAVRRAQRHRAARRAHWARHSVAALVAARVEAAAGGADADLDGDRARDDVRRDEARHAPAVDARRGAARRGRRQAFLVDLGALSGLPRVVAFLGVGVLLLVIGYLSPLPPARARRDDATTRCRAARASSGAYARSRRAKAPRSPC